MSNERGGWCSALEASVPQSSRKKFDTNFLAAYWAACGKAASEQFRSEVSEAAEMGP